MANIGTTLEIYDRMTAPLQSITNSLQQATSSIETMSDSLSEPVDMDFGKTHKVLDAVQNQLDALRDNVSDGIPEIKVPVTLDDNQARADFLTNWEGKSMDIFTNTGADRFNSELGAANSRLSELINKQNDLVNTADIEFDTNLQELGTQFDNFQNQMLNIPDMEIVTKPLDLAPIESQLNALPNETQLEFQVITRGLDDVEHDLNFIANDIQSMPDLDIGTNGVMASMQEVQSRLQGIEQMTTEFANMDIDIDVKSNGIEKVRQNLESIEQQQNDVNRAIENMDVEGANRAYQNLNKSVGDTERYLRDNIAQQDRFTQEVEQTNQSANRLSGTFIKMVGIIGAAFSVKQVIGLSDEMTNITSRLNLMNDGLQTTDELNHMIFQSAQRSRGSYLESADAVASLGGNARQAFENTQEIVLFSEMLNKQFTIAGTSVEGVSAATLQLTQAMGMGALRGEELNSVLEQAPNIVQTIADYMEVPIGQIKELASEGEITADVIKNAMFAATDEINAKFEEMPMTFAQIWTSFKNEALMAFQPVLQRINDIANSTAFQNFVSNAIEWVSILAHVTISAFEMMANLGQWIADRWSMIGPIVGGIVAILGVYHGAILAVTTAKAISAGITTALTVAQMAYAAVTGGSAAALKIAEGAQWGLNTAMLANPVFWVVIGVIALIAVLYAVVAAINHFTGSSISATGLIAGAFAGLAALVVNTVINTVNFLILTVNLIVNAFQVGVWLIQVAFYALGLALVFILDAIVNTGILAVNLLVNAWNFGVFAIQMIFIALVTLVLLIFDAILNAGIIVIELLVNAWNFGIFGLQMAWIGLNILVRNVLQAILNFGISIAESFANGWNDAIFGLQTAFYKFQQFVAKIMQAVGQGALGVVNAVLGGISSLVNTAISGLNGLIGMANKIPGVNIGTIGTVDFKVGDGAQSVIDSIGSGITAPVRAEQVSLNRSTMADDYNPDMPSMPETVSFDRSSLATDFLGSIDMPEMPQWEDAIDYPSLTDDYLGSVNFPEFPELEQTIDFLDYVNVGDWAKAGYDWGDNLVDTIKDFSLTDAIQDMLGMEDFDENALGDQMALDDMLNNLPDFDELTGGGLGDDADKATGGSSAADKAAKDLGKIADNTDEIKDNTGMSKEDLKYLRDLNARRAVNRFTSNVDFRMEGITINSTEEADLDGVVDYITRGLQQAVNASAEGEHH